MTTPAAIKAAIDAMTALRFFPAEPPARLEIAKLLSRMCPSDESALWTAQTMVDRFGEWKGTAWLRALLCAKYAPADGVRAELLDYHRQLALGSTTCQHDSAIEDYEADGVWYCGACHSALLERVRG